MHPSNKSGPPRTIVLMYHQIIPDEVPASWVPNTLADPRYGVRKRIFDEHLEILLSSGLPVISLEDCLSGKNTDAPLSLVITFDDGYASDFELAAQALSRAHLPATFFLSTARLGMAGMMTKIQAKALAAIPGLSIGAHGATHRFLTELTSEELTEELGEALTCIRELSDAKNIVLSAPGGRISPQVTKQSLEAGYHGLLTSNPGAYIKGQDPFSVPRLPVTCGISGQKLRSLLDPDAFSFRLDGWIRTLRRTIRENLSPPSRSQKN